MSGVVYGLSVSAMLESSWSVFGLSDLELDKNIVDIITSLQKLNSEDKEHIFTIINALVFDAKTRNTYA